MCLNYILFKTAGQFKEPYSWLWCWLVNNHNILFLGGHHNVHWNCHPIDLVAFHVPIDLQVIRLVLIDSLQDKVTTESCRHFYLLSRKAPQLFRTWCRVHFLGTLLGSWHIRQRSLLPLFHLFRLSGVARVFVLDRTANAMTPLGKP